MGEEITKLGIILTKYITVPIVLCYGIYYLIRKYIGD